jgi:type IV pilus biogenesis protein CpaD/CtpE
MVSIRMRVGFCLSATLLSACTHVEQQSWDFGVAVRQDLGAQIADPDALYIGNPTPGSNGPRNALAQKRYQNDEVIPPSAVGATAEISGPGAPMGNEAGAPMTQAVTQ